MSTLKVNDIQTITGTPNRGKVLQVIHTPFTTTFTTSSTTPVAVTGFNATITPSSTSSRILVMGYITMGQSTSAAYLMSGYITRNGTADNIADSAGSRGRFQFGTQQSGSLDATSMYTVVSLDSPSTTSSLTYQVYIQGESPQTVFINRGNESDGDTAITGRFVSSITLMEISG
jgi:hypothetical protein